MTTESEIVPSQTFKAVCTITWKMDAVDRDAGLLHAKEQLQNLLNTSPYGNEFEGFAVQLDIARMRNRKKMIHLAKFSLEDVFPHVTTEETKRVYTIDGRNYEVRMNSKRYLVFRTSTRCIACGLNGEYFMLDFNPGALNPHFNLYAEEHGRPILMTKDHILAKSRGGSDELANFETCCSTCNNLKGHFDLSYAQVKELRKLHDNNQYLTKSELSKVINSHRRQMLEVSEKVA